MYRKYKQQATAISYQEEKGAPDVVATGKGFVAQRIIDTAEKLGIPIIRNPLLAGRLSELSPGQEIPPELFEAVAEIYAFLFSIDKRMGEYQVES